MLAGILLVQKDYQERTHMTLKLSSNESNILQPTLRLAMLEKKTKRG